MKGTIIIWAIALSTPSVFALSMSPRIPQRSNTPAPAPRAKINPGRTTESIASPNNAMLARVTVYWAGGKGSDRFTRKHKTATGARLRTGHCAVDPRCIPYGSKVTLPDGSSLAAVDTGTAVKNRKAARQSGRTMQERNAIVVDRFFETKRQALAWAQTHPLFMPVKVASPNMVRTPTPVQSRSVAFNSNAPVMKAQPVAQPTPKPILTAKNNYSSSRNPLDRTAR